MHNILQNATKTYFVSATNELELSLLAHHNSQMLQNERSVTSAKSTLLNICTAKLEVLFYAKIIFQVSSR